MVRISTVRQSLSFGEEFNRSLKDVALPSGLQTLKLGKYLNLLQGVALPGLHSFSCCCLSVSCD